MELIAVWYVGLFIFAINGLVMLGHRAQVATHRREAAKVLRIVTKHIRKRGH